MKILDRRQIDQDQWNGWVQESPAGFPYLFTWYLDAVAPGWQAIVWEDRLALPIYQGRIKRIIPALIMPPFIQRYHFLGPGKELQENAIKDYRLIHKKFLASALRGERELFLKEEARVLEQPNRVLDLGRKYREIRKHYSSGHLRNVKRSVGIELFSNSGAEAFPDFLNLHNPKHSLGKHGLQRLRGLIEKARSNASLEFYSARHHDQTVAAALWIRGPRRYVYIAGASTSLGKERSAMHKIMDRFIQDKSDQPMLLDFEGSRIPGVDRFFKGFGARREVYFSLRLGMLSWL